MLQPTVEGKCVKCVGTLSYPLGLYTISQAFEYIVLKHCGRGQVLSATSWRTTSLVYTETALEQWPSGSCGWMLEQHGNQLRNEPVNQTFVCPHESFTSFFPFMDLVFFLYLHIR